ncbi:hypothetical protein ACGFNU_39235 [Spirillospora sp. NPDC048911]|uniref:hypothetical protein n=1 Tax=Spirillospora sp. NPDC048911 TaxID=3364527 RepID=UPI003718ED8C
MSGDVMVDDPLPGLEQDGNQRFIRELPEVRTTDLGECIATLKSHTAALCSYISVLEELGVPRMPRST